MFQSSWCQEASDCQNPEILMDFIPGGAAGLCRWVGAGGTGFSTLPFKCLKLIAVLASGVHVAPIEY
eukprot:10139335-Karenia_brevis.AAC.1